MNRRNLARIMQASGKRKLAGSTNHGPHRGPHGLVFTHIFPSRVATSAHSCGCEPAERGLCERPQSREAATAGIGFAVAASRLYGPKLTPTHGLRRGLHAVAASRLS